MCESARKSAEKVTRCKHEAIRQVFRNATQSKLQNTQMSHAEVEVNSAEKVMVRGKVHEKVQEVVCKAFG